MLLLFLVYYPLIWLLFPTPDPTITQSNYYINIPRINAQARIIPSIDPFNEKQYQAALKKGVAEAQNTDLFLFAHSSASPWEMTRQNTPFLRLNELQNGDQIEIVKNEIKRNYQVFDKKIVWPTETHYLKTTDGNLVLQTCVPIGTSFLRLLVFAKPT